MSEYPEVIDYCGQRWVRSDIVRELEQKVNSWEASAQIGHPSPCDLGPLCPYCEIERLNNTVASLTRECNGLERDREYNAELVAERDLEIERLRKALRPFADVARGIPESWPGHCRLRIDWAICEYECLSYHPATGARGKLLPMIHEWRAALKAIESEVNDG